MNTKKYTIFPLTTYHVNNMILFNERILFTYRAFGESENPTFRNLVTHAFCSRFPITRQMS